MPAPWGDGAAQLDDHVRAQRCYANALRSQRGDVAVDPVDAAPPAQPADAHVETRDRFGLPRLAD